jgi:DNA-binding NarL/FixJ family response regulator
MSRDAFVELLDGIEATRQHLLAKLHARDRAQLVIAAYESNLVRPRRR